jgi:hypothetical protein
MMPVASIASQPGCVETHHSAHFASAQPGDQALEPWPRHSPTSGPAEVIIDNFDLAESTSACDINELILTTAALSVYPNLPWSRLAYVDDRFAL